MSIEPPSITLPAATSDWIERLQSPDLAPYWLSAVIDSADDAVVTKTLDSRIVSWNKGAERIFGYTAEEVIGKSIKIIIPAERLDEEDTILSNIRAGKRVEHYETVRVRKDGRLVDISLTVSPVRGPDGTVIGASKIARDVTEDRRARLELRDTAQRLSLALDAAGLGDWRWDSDSDAVTFSEAAAAVFGVQPGSHMTWAETRAMLHEEDREAARLAVESAISERRDYGIEYRVIHPDGSQRWVLARGRATHGADGRVTGMLGVVQDITERKATEEALSEQTEALATINELGRLVSAELDLHKLVQAVTDAATELTGAQFGAFFYNLLNEQGASYMLYTLSGVPRAHFENFPMPRATDLFGPTFRGEGIIRIGDVKADARYGKNSPYFGMPEGHLPVTSYLAVPVVSRSGEVLGGLFFGHSEANVFTGRHGRIVEGLAAQAAVAMDNARLYETAQRAAVENERLYREAVEASRLKDEFLATLSHELRTPLTAILGWSRMLQDGQLDDEGRARALETIQRNAQLQSQLIEDVLDVSRIISGKMRLEVRPVELSAVIEAAVESMLPAAEAKGIRVQRVLDSGTSLVSGDPSRLQQVVWNLLTNAIKFTPKGGRVQVRLERVNSHVEIVVTDTGAGIPPDVLPYVFERFRQADSSTTRKHGGLGLGLAIVRHLVEMHGGTVAAESPGLGQGATFTVALPLVATRSVEVRPDPARVHPTAGGGVAFDCPAELAGLHVLVVDDEEDSRSLIKAVLEKCDANVTAVASAAEALDALQKVRPDVLLSDLGMPEEDGYSLISKVRALPAERGGQTPAAALTAYARVEDRMRVLRSGFQIHLPKPVEPAELVAVVANLAGRVRDGRGN